MSNKKISPYKRWCVKRDKLFEELDKMQKACEHPIQYVTVKHCGDTGNYDPTQDRYWTEYKCGMCGKNWEITTG